MKPLELPERWAGHAPAVGLPRTISTAAVILLSPPRAPQSPLWPIAPGRARRAGMEEGSSVLLAIQRKKNLASLCPGFSVSRSHCAHHTLPRHAGLMQPLLQQKKARRAIAGTRAKHGSCKSCYKKKSLCNLPTKGATHELLVKENPLPPTTSSALCIAENIHSYHQMDRIPRLLLSDTAL